ncbi:MAG: DNA repair protein RecN, partial [Alphaproteobacteria bacterium]|nr:DNA repair protein RecN [Alphaproteobacteria bacterium]
MLGTLSVRNIVLIDQLDIALDAGLTVLTGETGAGKSILLDALALALGGRGDQALVRAGVDSGQVTAVFHLAPDHPVRMLLRRNEIPDDEEVILRRVQYADGRTRAFINDNPVSASLLHEAGALAVEIHGQHADRALVDTASHRALLDAYGGHAGELDATAAAWRALTDAEAAVDRQRQRVERAQRDEDYARHVVAELTELAPEPGEEEALSGRRQHLMSIEKSADDVRDADEVLNGSTAPGPVLATLMRRLERKGSEGLFGRVIEALDQTLVALDHAHEALETLKREMDFDPQELERVEERLFAIRAAARKHQVEPSALPAVLDRYRADLAALESGAEELAALERAAQAARAAYVKAAAALSKARHKAARDMTRAVEKELPDLKLAAARFIVDLDSDDTRVAVSGFDQAAFHVQTNPGTKPGPIMKVASGGELSRFLLALKVVLADRGSAPVLIFDEIDTGVGGAVADAIGRRLGRLADRVQVISVTH